MWCAGAVPRARELQLHTIVDRPLTEVSHGRIVCRPVGFDPVEFEWHGPSGGGVQTDTSGSEAVGVQPGRYRVVATDARNRVAEASLVVEPALDSCIVVQEYRTTPASNGMARDGLVEALGLNLHTWSSFLWSNGARTREPVLCDASVGTYVVHPIPGDDGKVPIVVHQCAPAVVGVR